MLKPATQLTGMCADGLSEGAMMDLVDFGVVWVRPALDNQANARTQREQVRKQQQIPNVHLNLSLHRHTSTRSQRVELLAQLQHPKEASA